MTRSRWTLGAAVIAVAALAAGGVAIASGSSADISRPVRIHVIDVGTADVFRDLAPKGPSEGDLFTFSDKVVSSSNRSRVVGHLDGQCVLMLPKQNRFECHATSSFFDRGSITSEGIFIPAEGHVNTFAVNGGSGIFKNARGEVKFHAIPVGQDVTYYLIP